MSGATHSARRWWALWVLLLAGAPVHAQEGAAPPGEASPAPILDTADHRPLAEPGAPAEMPSPESSPLPATATDSPSRPAPAQAPPVVDPPVSAPPATWVSPAGVQPAPPATVAGSAPDERSHLGLFVHGDIGGGYLRVSGSRGGSSFSTDGGALGVGLAVGWAPDEEWAIALEFWSWKSLSDSSLGTNASVELQALGLNVTRYLVPANVFATVVVSGTRLAITDPGDHVEYAGTDIGFGFKVLLGKEWRLSSWVGLGLAGELFLSVNRDSGQTLRTLGAGLVFSFTGR